MHKPLLNEKVAILVANGFDEQDMIAAQKALAAAGAHPRVIAMDSGLVNSWNGTGWGLNFAADAMLNTALAADFSMLVVPGGSRSLDKLKLTAHTRRFLNGFLDARKPLALWGDAVSLLSHAQKAQGRVVAAPEGFYAELERNGAKIIADSYAIDGALMTTAGNAQERDALAQTMAAHFASCGEMEQAA